MAQTFGVSLARRVEAEIVLDCGKGGSWLRVGPDAAGNDGSLILAELEVVVRCHAFPLAHGSPGFGRLNEVHLDTARREVIGRRVGGLEYTVALCGFGDDELLLGRGDPYDPQSRRSRLKRGRSGITPDLS